MGLYTNQAELWIDAEGNPLGNLLFDSHAHYNDDRFDDDRDEVISNVMKYCKNIMNVGTNVESSKVCIDYAERYDGFYASVGIHPHDTEDAGDESVALDALREMLKHPKVRAIGEIGLDFHYDFSPRDIQRHWFELQMKLADETGYPVIIHDREAHGECVDMARRFPNVGGVFHCFSGSAETARELVAMGWYISFSGSVTFKNAEKVAQAMLAVPDDRLLIETDCPYLAPVPYRSKRNDSSLMRHTAAYVAERRGMSLSELCELTAKNAAKFYRL